VVAKVEPLAGKENPRFLVTNLRVEPDGVREEGARILSNGVELLLNFGLNCRPHLAILPQPQRRL
jgi:hypothetical protein